MPLVRATIDNALIDLSSRTARFAGEALFLLWVQDLAEGRRMGEEFFRSGNADLMTSVGRAVASLDFNGPEDRQKELGFIEALVASNDINVVSTGVDAIRTVAKGDPFRAMALVRRVTIGNSHRLADELLCLFCFSN